MAIKGFQSTRTKAQDLTEVVQAQDGFLGGLNEDNPRSDIGDTQVTTLNNAIPYRDRIEARGGLKPLLGYKESGETDSAVISGPSGMPIYDYEWDEFFSLSADFQGGDWGELVNYGKQDRGSTNCYNYYLREGLAPSDTVDSVRIKDNHYLTTENALSGSRSSLIEYRTAEDDYFLRPFTSVTSSDAVVNVTSLDVLGAIKYAFYGTYIRIVDGKVVAESNVISKVILGSDNELDGTVAPFIVVDKVGSDYFFPNDYYLEGGSDNFYTHIRYYRSKKTTNTDVTDFVSEPAYYINDYVINDIVTLPDTLDELNKTDDELSRDPSVPVLWQGGYTTIAPSVISCSSSGMFLSRNESRKNEFVYCPIGSGDNRKYLGWYNPLFQYGSVDGDITQMLDMGSYVVITTNSKTYYIDTVNFLEDAGQQSLGIFTPILSSTVLVGDIGVNFNQRLAFVKTAIGSAIGITSEGEIRELNGYEWGPDLSAGKVHSITKGYITDGEKYCQAAFVGDAYYLGYQLDGLYAATLRLGTTEESGNGFSKFSGGGWSPYAVISGLSGNTNAQYFYNVKGVLCVNNRINGDNSDFSIMLCEYTGGRFDKKINKDIIDFYTFSPLTYSQTVYYDIPVEIEPPEATGSSESYFLYYLKSNFFLRADRYCYKVENELLKGYEITDNDLTNVSLSDTEFGIELRKGESDDVVATNDNFDPSQAVVALREVQDKRIRVRLLSDSAGWQLTGLENHFKRHMRKDISTTTSSSYSEELNEDMFCHITEKLENLCVGRTGNALFDIGTPIEDALLGSNPSGRLVSGEAVDVSTEVGPDGKNSVIGLEWDGAYETTTYEFEIPPSKAISGFTLMFWQKGQFEGFVSLGWASNDEAYKLTGLSGTGWEHICYSHNGTTLSVYKNGVLDSSSGDTLDVDVNKPSVRIEGLVLPLGTPATAKYLLSDIRAYNKEITQEQISFYIDNVLNNNGDYFDGY